MTNVITFIGNDFILFMHLAKKKNKEMRSSLLINHIEKRPPERLGSLCVLCLVKHKEDTRTSVQACVCSSPY